MSKVDYRFYLDFEDSLKFKGLLEKKGFKNISALIRYLLYKELENNSISSPDRVQAVNQELIEKESYVTLRMVRTCFLLLLKNNAILEREVVNEQLKEIIEASMSLAKKLYADYETDFNKR